MNLRQMRYFVAVAEELSFTRAALRLGIAQPPLSQQIRQLEEEIGTKLFLRTRRAVELTEAGAAILPIVRRVLHDAEAIGEVARSHAGGLAGTVRLGAFNSALYTVLPPILERLGRSYPKISISITQLTMDEHFPAMIEGAVDMCITRTQRSAEGIRRHLLFREGLVAALPADHALAGRAEVALAELAGDALIVFRPGFSAEFRAAVLGFVAGVEFRALEEVDSTHLLLGLVAAGLGVSLIPESLAAIRLDRVSYVPLREETPLFEVAIVARSDLRPAPSVFLNGAVEVSRQIGDSWAGWRAG